MPEISERTQELRSRLAAARAAIGEAESAAGRPAGDVTMIAVTKFFPASDVRILAELGVADVGENRAQEGAAKYAACADLEIQWHFIGQLQSNKCASVVSYADLIHSVDRPKLVTELARAAAAEDRQAVRCLVQINLDAASTGSLRGGVSPSAARDLANSVASAEGLEFAGVMGVAPLAGDPLPAFEQLREISAALTEDHPSATIISAGMSGDFASAIRAGATHIRLGAAVLGRRPTVR